jgi:hypothetical protein
MGQLHGSFMAPAILIFLRRSESGRGVEVGRTAITSVPVPAGAVRRGAARAFLALSRVFHGPAYA